MKKYSSKTLFLLVGIGIILLIVICALFCKKEMNMCYAVQNYLSAADFQWVGQEVKKWDEIVVDYIGRLQDGSIFDTNVESVAKWCDNYNEQRNYEEWLSFVVGAGQMIWWFDRWVEWMKIWQTKTIEIAAIDAYGEWDESKVMVVEKSKLSLPWQYKEWDVLYTPNGQAVKVHKVTKKEVYLDTNHELADKSLIFDITIKEIK